MFSYFYLKMHARFLATLALFVGSLLWLLAIFVDRPESVVINTLAAIAFVAGSGIELYLLGHGSRR